MNDRAKTTPNSTAGSFAPSAGARSRVEPGERVCECGQPITSKDPAAEVCMHCYYEGKPLAAAFASQIAKLSAATGREWNVEHTGGGCFWIATRSGDAYVAITGSSGELSGADTPDDIAEADGYMIGMYTDEEDEGTYLNPSYDDDDLVAAAVSACNTVFNAQSEAGDNTTEPDDDGERRCATCSDSFNTEDGGTDFDADAGGPLCNRCTN